MKLFNEGGSMADEWPTLITSELKGIEEDWDYIT